MLYRERVKIPKTELATLLLLFLLSTVCPLKASDPYSASYSTDNDRIFWFIMMSDIHIGAEDSHGSENLEWMLTEAKDVINPSFIVAAGDLTDSTNWSVLGYPDGPHIEEWAEYLAILVRNGIDENFYYDLPGNHDHFGDQNFNYYLNHSIQGVATGQTQFSWTRTFNFGTYHFLGINTCGNDGADFSMLPPNYGDNAGLDSAELLFIEQELSNHSSADLTLVFGHHLIVKRSIDLTDLTLDEMEAMTMTALSYGADEFVALMDYYNSLIYGYGHSHVYREEFFINNMADGVVYLNVASLAKSDENNYNIIAIDCNGISTVPQTMRTWPVVIITAPLDKNLGMKNNPYTSGVADNSGNSTPIRALVFDKEPIMRVEYRMYKIQEPLGDIVEDGIRQVGRGLDAVWHPMNQVASVHPNFPYLWEADCANPLEGGDYSIEVRAIGSTIQYDNIPTAFPAAPIEDEGTCFITSAAAGNPSTTKR
jgi:hypothetical protein